MFITMFAMQSSKHGALLCNSFGKINAIYILCIEIFSMEYAL